MGRAEPDMKLPAPQVRVESQFRYSKFLSQQWQLANDYLNWIIEPRGVWTSRPLEKTGEDIPTSHEVIGAHMLNFWPKF